MKERDALIEEARAFDQAQGEPSDVAAMMADFALRVLERESIYREICEAARHIGIGECEIYLDHVKSDFLACRNNDNYTHFDTLPDAFAFVKGERR